MSSDEKRALVDERASALTDDTRRQPDGVRLHEVNQRPNVREQVQNVDNFDAGQVSSGDSTGVGSLFRIERLGREQQRRHDQGGVHAIAMVK
jgi:hypothetical protein